MNSKQAEATRLKLEQFGRQCQELRERAEKAEAERDALAAHMGEILSALNSTLDEFECCTRVAKVIEAGPEISLVRRDARIAYETISATTFPTMLRKMWSGGEVQAWLENEAEKHRQQAEGGES